MKSTQITPDFEKCAVSEDGYMDENYDSMGLIDGYGDAHSVDAELCKLQKFKEYTLKNIIKELPNRKRKAHLAQLAAILEEGKIFSIYLLCIHV